MLSLANGQGVAIHHSRGCSVALGEGEELLTGVIAGSGTQAFSWETSHQPGSFQLCPSDLLDICSCWGSMLGLSMMTVSSRPSAWLHARACLGWQGTMMSIGDYFPMHWDAVSNQQQICLPGL